MRLTLFAMIVVFGAPVVAAQIPKSPEVVLKSFGLTGHLADDCMTRIGRGHVRFLAQQDGTVRVNTFGPGGRPFTMIISEAKLVSDNELQVRTSLAGGKPTFTSIWEKQGNKFRIRSSTTEAGKQTLKTPEEGDWGRDWISACTDA